MAVNILSLTMFVSFYKCQKEGCWKTAVLLVVFSFFFAEKGIMEQRMGERKEEKRKKRRNPELFIIQSEPQS